MGGNKRSEAAGTSRRSLAALQKKKKEKDKKIEEAGRKKVSPCVFVCVILFSHDGGMRSFLNISACFSLQRRMQPPTNSPDVFLRSLSAELLCDCSSLRLSALIPVFSSAALVTTSYGLQTHSSSCLHEEKSEGQYAMTGSG